MGSIDDIKTVERIGWGLLSLPLVPIIVLMVFALLVWLQAGHFPSSGDPYPKDLGMGTLHLFALSLTYSAGYLWILSIFSVIALLVSGLQRRKVLRNIVIVLFANAFYIWFMIGDPLSLVRWIGD
jgi:hypothetical protein